MEETGGDGPSTSSLSTQSDKSERRMSAHAIKDLVKKTLALDEPMHRYDVANGDRVYRVGNIRVTGSDRCNDCRFCKIRADNKKMQEEQEQCQRERENVKREQEANASTKPVQIIPADTTLVMINVTIDELKEDATVITPDGIIRLFKENVVKSRSGKDQISLGPGYPVIQFRSRGSVPGEKRRKKNTDKSSKNKKKKIETSLVISQDEASASSASLGGQQFPSTPTPTEQQKEDTLEIEQEKNETMEIEQQDDTPEIPQQMGDTLELQQKSHTLEMEQQKTDTPVTVHEESLVTERQELDPQSQTPGTSKKSRKKKKRSQRDAEVTGKEESSESRSNSKDKKKKKKRKHKKDKNEKIRAEKRRKKEKMRKALQNINNYMLKMSEGDGLNVKTEKLDGEYLDFANNEDPLHQAATSKANLNESSATSKANLNESSATSKANLNETSATSAQLKLSRLENIAATSGKTLQEMFGESAEEELIEMFGDLTEEELLMLCDEEMMVVEMRVDENNFPIGHRKAGNPPPQPPPNQGNESRNTTVGILGAQQTAQKRKSSSAGGTASKTSGTGAPSKTEAPSPKTEAHSSKTGGAPPKTEAHSSKTGGAPPKTEAHSPKTEAHSSKTGGAPPKTEAHSPKPGAHSKSDTSPTLAGFRVQEVPAPLPVLIVNPHPPERDTTEPNPETAAASKSTYQKPQLKVTLQEVGPDGQIRCRISGIQPPNPKK